MRLAVVASHPIQYQAPLFRELAKRVDLTVYFAHHATPADQARAGFGTEFEWDSDLVSGYENVFLRNVSSKPGLQGFSGCDTPEIANRLNEGKFDVLMVNGWHRKSFLQSVIAAKRKGIPVLARGDSQLATLRSPLKRFAKRLSYPIFLRTFDAALYVGQRSREYWIHYGYPRKKLFFSPHCVDTEWFALRATASVRAKFRTELGVSPETKLILFAGKLVSFKRPADLVCAIGQLITKGRQVELLVVGSGPLHKELALLADKTGISSHFLGFRNQTEMPFAYAAADVLVLPSDGKETWGLVVNEALACGTPIVVSNEAGCAPDLAADRTAGRTFPSGDIPALTAAIDDLLANPPSAQAIADRSRAYCLAGAAEGIVRAATFVCNERRHDS